MQLWHVSQRVRVLPVCLWILLHQPQLDGVRRVPRRFFQQHRLGLRGTIVCAVRLTANATPRRLIQLHALPVWKCVFRTWIFEVHAMPGGVRYLRSAWRSCAYCCCCCCWGGWVGAALVLGYSRCPSVLPGLDIDASFGRHAATVDAGATACSSCPAGSWSSEGIDT